MSEVEGQGNDGGTRTSQIVVVEQSLSSRRRRRAVVGSSAPCANQTASVLGIMQSGSANRRAGLIGTQGRHCRAIAVVVKQSSSRQVRVIEQLSSRAVEQSSPFSPAHASSCFPDKQTTYLNANDDGYRAFDDVVVGWFHGFTHYTSDIIIGAG